MTKRNERFQAAIRKGEKAEVVFTHQFGGTRTTVANGQYDDIDVRHPNGHTYSVKDQLYSSSVYGGITIEMELEDTSTGKKIDGCFVSGKASTYAWAITHEGKQVWLMMRSDALHDYVDANRYRWVKKTTKSATTQDNASQGRKYDRAHIYAVPIADLLANLPEDKFKIMPIQRVAL